MLVKNIDNLSEKESLSFLNQISSQILSQEGLNSKAYEDKLKDQFPKVYITFKEFSETCRSYVNLIEESGIKNEFGKYIVVDKLDK